ncbi:MAG TPA: SDR family oxidoreductase [Trebonia sp.]|nr:SDR family oxidoreductase [Trebonia sp.]
MDAVWLLCQRAGAGMVERGAGKVNAILPGYFRTGRDSPAYTDPVVQARIPAGRFGEPEDIVGSVVFLASRAADYVTGHHLVVDGGWHAR